MIAFFIMRKSRLIPTRDFNLMNEINSSITVDNALQTVMNEDIIDMRMIMEEQEEYLII